MSGWGVDATLAGTKTASATFLHRATPPLGPWGVGQSRGDQSRVVTNVVAPGGIGVYARRQRAHQERLRDRPYDAAATPTNVVLVTSIAEGANA
jgi:hypothetical protein